MNSQYLTKLAKMAVPDSPGVYFFVKNGLKSRREQKGQKESPEILYIGRATSLRDRVKSYFKNDLDETRGPLITDMLAKADKIKWRQTDSVLEAIILESNLIKQFQPKHNTKEKDDRSYNYVVITNEDFPRVMLTRGRELEKMGMSYTAQKIYGPYPHGELIRQALSIIRKIFPFRDAKSGIPQNEAFYRSIGLSPDTSSPDAKKEYAKTIRNLNLFFQGKKKALISALEKEMKSYAKSREFEKAGRVKRTLYALGHIQDVSLIKRNVDIENNFIIKKNNDVDKKTFRIEAYDVAHLSGSENVGVMTVVMVRGDANRSYVGGPVGEPDKNEYRKFKISRDVNNDVASLSEILHRRLHHTEWPLPDLIVVDGGIGQIHAAEKILATPNIVMSNIATLRSNHAKIPVVSVVKDERHTAKNIVSSAGYDNTGRGGTNHNRNEINILVNRYRSSILLANAEAHRFAIAFHRHRLRRRL